MEKDYLFTWIVSGLSLLASYLLRLAHSDTRDDIKELKDKVGELSESQSKMETKQNELEKSIEKEIKHIREIMDSRLKTIEDGVKDLIKYNRNNGVQK